MAIQRRQYIGKGSFYAKLRSASDTVGYFPLGNCEKAERKVETAAQEIKDYENPGGGLVDKKENIKSVVFGLTCSNFAPRMIALVQRGSVSTVAAGQVTDEEVTAFPEALVPFNYQPDAAQPVVVEAKDGKNAVTWAATTARAQGVYIVPSSANGSYYKVTTAGTSGSSAPAFPATAGATVTDGTCVLTNMGRITKISGTDYILGRAGILMTSAAGSCEAGRVLLVDYVKLAGQNIEALTQSGDEYSVILDGLNEAESGKPVTLRLWRITFSPTAGFPSISDEFAKFDLSLSVLQDATITGAGLSKYMREQWAD